MQVGRIFLVDREGKAVHSYLTTRLFGRIQWRGEWYRSMHKRDRPDIYELEA